MSAPRIALALLLASALAAVAGAQAPVAGALPALAAAAPDAQPLAASAPAEALAAAAADVVGAAAGLAAGEHRAATAVEIAVLLTLLSLLPAILVTVTCFTRIVIVLSFVRRALSINELPPNPVLIGLALFLTTFVMAPVAERVHERAWVPYRAGALPLEEAGDTAWRELGAFLVANTRESELALFADLSKLELSSEQIAEELPLRVVVPAFVLSEVKTAFQMGFLLFLPFLVIDLVVSSVLLSMGMFMLPPVMISTPFKILVFVLVDGWHLVCESLVTSFASA